MAQVNNLADVQYPQIQNNSAPSGHFQSASGIPDNVPQIVTQPTQQMYVENQSMPWSWCSLITSMIATLFCSAFGFIATVLSILAYVDHSANQFRRSSEKINVAYGLSIAGIVIGAIIFIIIIIM